MSNGDIVCPVTFEVDPIDTMPLNDTLRKLGAALEVHDSDDGIGFWLRFRPKQVRERGPGLLIAAGALLIATGVELMLDFSVTQTCMAAIGPHIWT